MRFGKKRFGMCGTVFSLVLIVISVVTYPANGEEAPGSSNIGTAKTGTTVLKVGDPINAATGEYFFTMNPFNLGGPLPVVFSLFYGSQMDAKRYPDGLPSVFAGTHTGGVTRYTDLTPEEAFVDTGAGKEYGFHKNGTTWETFSLEGVRCTLRETGGFFYLLQPEKDLVYTYEKEAIPWSMATAERISENSEGEEADSSSERGCVSEGGLYVAFVSNATNLVSSSDTNYGGDIFIRDRRTGSVSLVSVSLDGNAGGGTSNYPSISRDGRYVAFESYASDLVEGDTNGKRDIFVRDREAGSTYLVSISSAGVAADGVSTTPSISADGRYVAFTSEASNLVANDENGVADIFVHDRDTGITTLVSKDSEGVQGDNGSPYHYSSISADGRYVAFTSAASNLVANDENDAADIFVHDRDTGTTTRVSLDSEGTEGNGSSEWPAISADGRYVAFHSSADNLVSGDTNGCRDLFMHDRNTGVTTMVSVAQDGGMPNGISRMASISSDGRYIAFESWASNLVENDTNNKRDVFVRDMQEESTVRASVGVSGTQANDYCLYPCISPDGDFVVFDTAATTLVDDVVNESREDVYLAVVSQASRARLVRIEDRNGNALTYSYGEGDFTYLPTSVADGLGRSLSFTYNQVGTQDTNKYLVSVTDDQGRTFDLAYEENPSDNPQGLVLRSVMDPMAATTTFAYAGYGAIAGVTYPEGNTPYTQTYQEGSGVVATQQDADGNVMELSLEDSGGGEFVPYESEGSSLTEARPDNTSYTYRHDHQGRVAKSLTDPDGNTAQFSSDSVRDEITGVTDRLGGVTTLTSDPDTGLTTSVTNALGNTISYTYAAQEQAFSHPGDDESVTFTFHDPTKEEYPDGTSLSLAYDEKGNITSMTDPSGGTWTFAYDEQGRMTSGINPVGGTTTYTYNTDGTTASTTDPDGVIAAFTYDAMRRRTGITVAGTSTTTMDYDGNGRMTRITHPTGSTYEFTYDTNGNLTSIIDPKGNTTALVFDLMDRTVSATDRTGAATTTGYDTMGRISSVTDPTNVASDFHYDSLGRLAGMTRGGDTWQTDYDAEGVVSSRTTPLGHTTGYVTDALGQVTRMTDACGRNMFFEWDALNRITSATDGLGRTIGIAYGPGGLLSSITLPQTGTMTLQYDAMGALTGITDRRGNSWPFTRFKSGRMESAATPSGYEITYEYDNQGRVSSETGSDGRSVSLTRDAAGNVTRKTRSDGTVFTYAYDELDRLTATEGLTLTRDAEGLVEGTSTGEKTFGAVYDEAGRLVTVSYGGGFNVDYSYDGGTGLLTGLGDTLTGAWMTLTYDRDRRLTGITRSNGVNGTYTYNNAGELVRIREGGIIDCVYTLDNASQVVSADMTVPLDPAEALGFRTRHYEYDSACSPQSSGHSSDTAGNTTSSPSHNFRWNAESLLTRVDDTDLSYNGMGDLLTRTENGITTRYHYNYGIGLHPIVAEEAEATGTVTRYYVWSPQGELLYSIGMTTAEPSVRFYHFDLTGSTLALTDKKGLVTDAYAYTPYGRVLGHQGESLQPFTYAGKWGVRQEGKEGDLFHIRARYYDAGNGRFLSPEPLRPREPDLHMLNPYLYAHANPVSLVDVTGCAPASAGTMGLTALTNEYKQFDKLNKSYEKNLKDSSNNLGACAYILLKGVGTEYLKDFIESLKETQDKIIAQRELLERSIFFGNRELQKKMERLIAHQEQIKKKIKELRGKICGLNGKICSLEGDKATSEKWLAHDRETAQKELAFLDKIYEEAAGSYDSPSIKELIQESEQSIYKAREDMEKHTRDMAQYNTELRTLMQKVQTAERQLKSLGGD